MFSWDIESGEADKKYGSWAENKGDYLCVNEISSTAGGHLEVVPRTYDSHYQEVQRDNLVNIGRLRGPDGHDFHMLPGGRSFLHTVTPKKPYDSEAVQQLWQTKVEDPAANDAEAADASSATSVTTITASSTLIQASSTTSVSTSTTNEAANNKRREDFDPQHNVNSEQVAQLAADQSSNERPDELAKGISWLWVYDACFQEVDIKSRGVTFEWCFLDHFNVTEVNKNMNRT